MRRVLPILLGVCTVGLVGWATAERTRAGTVEAVAALQETVTGVVIDLTCYTADRANTGHDHVGRRGRGTQFACDLACVRWEGQPAAVLTSDLKVYQVAGGLAANSNAKIAEHLAQSVRITGEVYELDGMMMIEASDLTVVEE